VAFVSLLRRQQMVVLGRAVLLIAITFILGAGAPGDGVPCSQKDIASFLAQQERLVGSMHCVFEQRLFPTAPESIPLISFCCGKA